MKAVRTTLARFIADERGNALIFVTLMLPVLVGFSVLAIDMSRVSSLHNDLQSGVDALALAGAAELDGKANARSRATTAIQTLITDNSTKFSTAGNHTLTSADVTITFLSGLPPSDSTALNADGTQADGVSWVAASDSAAQFAEVTVKPTSTTAPFQTIFPVSFLPGGGTNTLTVTTQSVAGYQAALCDFTPMFICNPYTSLAALENALTGTRKPMIWLKEQQGGSSAQYGPGNYGFLSSPEGDKSTASITEMFAVTNPPACYTRNGVTTRPGNIPPVNDGINTRFDMFSNGGPYKTDPAINPPAPNVRKGMVVQGLNGNNCQYNAPNSGQAKNYMALPRDNCFVAGTCSSAGVLGDGNWNFIGTKAAPGYWDTNWPKDNGTGVKAACGNTPSRYCVYKYEIQHKADLVSTNEQTAPQCNATTQGPERRLLYVAVIDCVANQVKGGGQTLPVQAFASMLVTEPAGGPPNADIYAEIEDISTKVGQGTLNGLQRNESQLYR
ncbi:MAG TPA: pilus assembly protein TadG-related protein [Devosiaceae bacterium]|nr:pilus assembly protein TadG-related protein [Devosiaceae bacterium]